MFTELRWRTTAPRPLFEAGALGAPERRDRLMNALDRINEHMGRGTARFAGEGMEQSWRTRSRARTPAYTTRLTELPVVRAI